MKKLLLALLLLVIVLAVGYFRAARQNSQVTSAYESGRSEGNADLSRLTERNDSLAQLAEGYKEAFAESLEVMDSLQTTERDSLAQLLSKKDDSLARLRKLAQKTQDSQKKPPRKSYSSTEILSFYKSSYRELPKDLSPYERRVALTELRDKTARKFSITLAELDKIRKDNDLDY